MGTVRAVHADGDGLGWNAGVETMPLQMPGERHFACAARTQPRWPCCGRAVATQGRAVPQRWTMSQGEQHKGEQRCGSSRVPGALHDASAALAAARIAGPAKKLTAIHRCQHWTMKKDLCALPPDVTPGP